MEQQSNESRATERANEKVQEVADYLRGHNVGEIATDARTKAEELAGAAKAKSAEIGSQATERVDEAISSAGQQMSNLAQTLREHAPDGKVKEVAETAAGALERSGQYLQQADIQTVRSDLEMLIRRHPVESLLIGFGLGFVLARGMRR